MSTHGYASKTGQQTLISIFEPETRTGRLGSDVKFHEIFWREMFHEIFREIFLKYFTIFFRAVQSK